jgi:adenine phosphoribosyltransferase
MDLRATIRDVPDFPKKGIVFKDITTLLRDPAALRHVIDRFEERWKPAGVGAVLGIESRGFIFGGALADRLGAAFVPARKPGKLPWRAVEERYQLEYGEDALQVHEDAVRRGEKVLVVDDLLATGGTAAAACGLVSRLGGTVVGCAFVVELAFLHGRDRLAGRPIQALVIYDAE